MKIQVYGLRLMPGTLIKEIHETQSGDMQVCVADLRQNMRDVVNPVGERAVDQVVDQQRLPLGVDNEVLPHHSLFLFLCLLVELVIADRRDVSPGADACNLCSKVVHLAARERRIADDLRRSTTNAQVA